MILPCVTSSVGRRGSLVLRYRWTRAICMHSAHELCIFVYLHARVFPTVGTHIPSSRPPAHDHSHHDRTARRGPRRRGSFGIAEIPRLVCHLSRS